MRSCEPKDPKPELAYAGRDPVGFGCCCQTAFITCVQGSHAVRRHETGRYLDAGSYQRDHRTPSAFQDLKTSRVLQFLRRSFNFAVERLLSTFRLIDDFYSALIHHHACSGPMGGKPPRLQTCELVTGTTRTFSTGRWCRIHPGMRQSKRIAIYRQCCHASIDKITDCSAVSII